MGPSLFSLFFMLTELPRVRLCATQGQNHSRASYGGNSSGMKKLRVKDVWFCGLGVIRTVAIVYGSNLDFSLS